MFLVNIVLPDPGGPTIAMIGLVMSNSIRNVAGVSSICPRVLSGINTSCICNGRLGRNGNDWSLYALSNDFRYLFNEILLMNLNPETWLYKISMPLLINFMKRSLKMAHARTINKTKMPKTQPNAKNHGGKTWCAKICPGSDCAAFFSLSYSAVSMVAISA